MHGTVIRSTRLSAKRRTARQPCNKLAGFGGDYLAFIKPTTSHPQAALGALWLHRFDLGQMPRVH